MSTYDFLWIRIAFKASVIEHLRTLGLNPTVGIGDRPSDMFVRDNALIARAALPFLSLIHAFLV